VRDEEFIAGRLDTGFIGRFNERRAAAEQPSRQIESDLAAIAAGLCYALQQQTATPSTHVVKSRWKMTGRNAALHASTFSSWRKS
jgi:acetyl/propionyl-CoA carboxylase alpha subunit